MTSKVKDPELLTLLLGTIAQQLEQMASTEDVMRVGIEYLKRNHSESSEKSLQDSVRWALIYMADETNWLTRPFGKLNGGSGAARRAWLGKHRPGQKTSQNVWAITPAGNQQLAATSVQFSQIVQADIESQNLEMESITGIEGGKQRHSSYFERNRGLREAAIRFHGLTCNICGFNFEERYGERGRAYIEVHHLKPVSSFTTETEVSPLTDMTTVCANCHRMIHRHKDNILEPEQLRKMLKKAETNR